MFRVTTTGKNKNYGEKGEERFLADNRLDYCLREGWIEPKVEFIGKMLESPEIITENILRAEKRVAMEQQKIAFWKKELERAKDVRCAQGANE